MRSTEERIAAALTLALLTAGCVTGSPPGRSAGAAGPTAYSTPPQTASPTQDEPRPKSSGLMALPSPGLPWDGPTVLRELAGTNGPNNVPDEVRTSSVAEAIAATVWTVDGSAWDTIAIGGYCGQSTCTIDIAGTHLGRAGEDLWTLEVDPAAGSVVPLVSDVRSIPWDLVDALDRLARSLDDDGALSLMILSTARWLPPPTEAGRFLLSYRSGGEEGSCARDLVLDASGGTLVEEHATGC